VMAIAGAQFVQVGRTIFWARTSGQVLALNVHAPTWVGPSRCYEAPHVVFQDPLNCKGIFSGFKLSKPPKQMGPIIGCDQSVRG